MSDQEIPQTKTEETKLPAKSVNNVLGRTGRDKDFLYTAEGSKGFPGEKKSMEWDSDAGALLAKSSTKPITARYTSPVIACKFPATKFLPSWNILLPRKDQSYKIFLRVGDESKVKFSPWFLMGEGGNAISDKPVKREAKGWGTSRIDYLHLTRVAYVFQYKVEILTAGSLSPDESPGLRRFFIHYSGQGTPSRQKNVTLTEANAVRIDVPYRSQLDVTKKSLKHIVCCPTCVSMVLEHHGINQPTLSICDAVYDQRYKIYGVWPKASQAAFQHGCRSWVHRFRGMAAVRDHLRQGQPIIASIRVGKGELRGARYPKSDGHLIVITGYNGLDKVRVNDPYSVGPGGGEIEYETSDIEKVWLDKGGVAILIELENI